MTDTHTHPFRYAAFISYSHADEAAAGWLHLALEGFKPPEGLAIPAKDALPRTDKLAPVFRDREELASGADLPSLITTALEASGALIVLCSPRSAQSQWVNQEIRAFRDMHGDDRIFALIVEGDPADEISCFPPALLEKIGQDGAILPEPREPLAADIRPGKDGKPLAKLKLAAGLMGVGLDDLARREDARARKRMMAVTAASLTGMVFAAGLAAVALLSRQEAVRQRARAETEAMTATRTAEFMIDLFEVADPSEARGREITAKEILDKGVASIETSLEGEPKVQADLMHTMGRVYTGLGLYQDAAGLLENAGERRRLIDAPKMEIFETDAALASALYEVGEFDRAGEIYARLSAQAESTDNAEWRPVMANALSGMGDVKNREMEYEEAEKNFRSAVTHLETNRMTDTDEYSTAMIGLGYALMYQDKYDPAVSTLLKAVDLTAARKGNEHFEVGNVEAALGTAYYFAGDLENSKNHFENALVISRKNLSATHPELAVGLNNLGRIHYELGNIGRAHELITEAVEIQKNSDRDSHVDFAFFLYTLGSLETEQDHFESSQSYFEQAIDLLGSTPHRLKGPLKLELGRALCGQGKTEDGLEMLSTAQPQLDEFYSAGDWRYGAADEFESFCHAKNGARSLALSKALSGYKLLQTARGDEHHFTRRAKAWMESLERG
ncbi:MAG: toll/interleukin-1 receptor domain-containing protein [Pseudomonadota bacterium]